MKRPELITLLRVTGYHDDRRGWMRLYTENRISITAAQRAWREGKNARAIGVRCGCADCKGVSR